MLSSKCNNKQLCVQRKGEEARRNSCGEIRALSGNGYLSLCLCMLLIWKLNQKRENVHIIIRHVETERWRWKEKRIRSKRRQIERTTLTTKTNIRKSCRCFSHLFYLSSVIISGKPSTFHLSLVCMMLSLFFLLFSDASSFAV